MNFLNGTLHRGLGAFALALTISSGWAAVPNATPDTNTLRRRDFRSGDETLLAFAPVAEATRHSIVKLNVDGGTVALGTVVDTNGLALTKASEIKPGKLTCWLATDQEVEAELLGVDEEEDLALVRIRAQGLKPIAWAAGEVALGQWAITPGLGPIPHAVGIVSARPRRIRPPRAYLGVVFDREADQFKIAGLMPGLGAEKAGLKTGDIVLAVNETSITNREQVVEILRDFHDGQVVKLQVQRGEKKFDAEVGLQGPSADSLGQSSESSSRASRLTGAVSQRAQGFEQVIQHDTVLPPWLCGGPLVNLDGQAIGLNIARAGRVATYALPARLVQLRLNNLRAKQSQTRPAGK